MEERAPFKHAYVRLCLLEAVLDALHVSRPVQSILEHPPTAAVLLAHPQKLTGVEATGL